MDVEIKQALRRDRLIDITTIGRKTGRPHRIEIGFFLDDERIFLTGLPPRKRDWYANLIANPKLTVHLKGSLKRDIPARATAITDPPARRAIFSRMLRRWKRLQELETWIEHSPLVQVSLEV